MPNVQSQDAITTARSRRRIRSVGGHFSGDPGRVFGLATMVRGILLCLLSLLAVSAAVPASAGGSGGTCPDTQPGVCNAKAVLLQTLPDSGVPACCAACVAQPLCIGYTLNSETKHCFLHSSWNVSGTGSSQCTSGHVRTAPVAPKGAKNVLLLYVACQCTGSIVVVMATLVARLHL